MQDGLMNAIVQKRTSAGKMLEKAIRLSQRSEELDKNIRSQIPSYTGDWEENDLEDFLERFEEAIINPIRHKNREDIESLNIDTREISDEIFDLTGPLKNTIVSLKKVKDLDEKVFHKLTEKNIVTTWLRVGPDQANSRLNEIIDGYTNLKLIIDSHIPDVLKDDLISHLLPNFDSGTDLEGFISEISNLQEYGINVTFSGEISAFKQEIVETSELVSNLERNLGLSKTKLVQIVNGCDLKGAKAKLSNKVSSLVAEMNNILKDYNLYRRILISMGNKVDLPPSKLDDLIKAVTNMRTKFFEDLGDKGPLILSFLQGDSELDEKVSMADVKNFLVRFRPVFQQFLNKEI